MGTSSDTVGQTAYAQKRREILSFAKDLRAMGAESEIGMPRIVVIGRQSAGKSSVVEAVTGVGVPRDSDTCTRCPMECTILTAERWSCRISLRLLNSPETPFSPILTSKAEVELWIRRAQAAALCPIRQGDFIDKTADELRSLVGVDADVPKFTRNVVVVDINDPDGTDLSFIDLPGLISNEEQNIIDLVRSLVEFYIKDEATIILVTIPASDDMALQEAARLAREVDPNGERTIGIITKPDFLPDGAIDLRKTWQSILRGEAHPLRLGYYGVRLPSDKERKKGLSRAEVEKLAMQFFKDNEPWKDLLHLNRLGIACFIADISKVLMRVIRESLPGLKEKVNTQLGDCVTQLNSMPKPITGGATAEILGRVTRFCNDLKEAVNGHTEDNTFVHRNRAIYQTFKISIRRTAPDFRPFLDPTQFVGPKQPWFSEEYEDREDTELAEQLPPAPVEPIGIYDVRRVIKDSIGWELPHNVPYEAKKRLYKKFVDRWAAPCDKAFDAATVILTELVNDKIRDHFGRFKALELHVGPLIRRELQSCTKRAAQSLCEVLEREKSPYFTQNGYYLESMRAHCLARYWFIRRNENDYKKGALWDLEREEELAASVFAESDSYHESPTERALKALALIGYKNLAAEDLVRLHPPDGFEDELTVMADVRAYFQVAYKRIIDNVPMSIQKDLNQQLSNGMQDCLLAELGVGAAGTAERFQELLAEDPAVTAQRDLLEKRKARLLEIQWKLNAFVIA